MSGANPKFPQFIIRRFLIIYALINSTIFHILKKNRIMCVSNYNMEGRSFQTATAYNCFIMVEGFCVVENFYVGICGHILMLVCVAIF